MSRTPRAPRAKTTSDAKTTPPSDTQRTATPEDFGESRKAARSAAMERKVKSAARRAKNGKKGKITGGTVGQLRELAKAGEDISEARATVHVGKANTAILTGQEDLSTWTDEDLLAGQRAGPDGKRTGRPPLVIPKAIHDELVKRTLSEAAEVLRTNLVEGVKALGVIARDPEAPEPSRIRAIEIIMDRTMGKAPDRVEISAEMPWLDALTDSIVATEDDFHDIIDAASHPRENPREDEA